MSFNDPLADPLVFGEQDKVTSVVVDKPAPLMQRQSRPLAHVLAPAPLLHDMQDLADLADLSLDPALVDDPIQAVGGSDPFASLASEPKQDGAYTYGQLVTPQAPPQATATAPGSADVAAGTSSHAAPAVSTPDGAMFGASPLAPAQAPQADPFAGLQGSVLSSSQPDLQHSHQQQPGMQDLLSAEASTPRMLTPEPPVNMDLPLFITVSEPLKREAAGMLGMKGKGSCLRDSSSLLRALAALAWLKHSHTGAV